MLTEDELEFIRHQFILREVNLTEVLKAGWVDEAETALATEYTKTWLGKLLMLPNRKPKIRYKKLRRYDVTLLLDGIYHCDFALKELSLITVAGRKKWGIFYSKYVDEILKPSEKRLEMEVWDQILEELVKIKPQIEEAKRHALSEIEGKIRNDYQTA